MIGRCSIVKLTPIYGAVGRMGLKCSTPSFAPSFAASKSATPASYRTLVSATRVGKKNNIIKLDMDAPPVNFLNIELMRALKEKVEEAEATADCAGIVVGSAQRVFCAGLDLKSLYGTSPESLRDFWITFQDLLIALYSSQKAVVACVAGHCPAGGYMIASCADVRVAAPGVKVGLNEAAFGLVAPYFGVDLMTDLVGPRVAYRAVCLGTLHDTSDVETLQQGFVDVVAPTSASTEEVEALAVKECELWLRAPGRVDSKALIRNATTQRFKANKAAEAERFVKAVTDPATQLMIGNYMEALKKKK